ncbi:MAG: amylo-alpha-1,6-glucosidase [Actinomycetota bacterium]|nr:amylo-alpha-1,6-glucosidase [Actinomycetota bacterium]
MPGLPIRFGRQVCGSLEEAASREWLVADGLGGFAMGTVAGLRTRRYHGLLVVATQPPIGRRLGLASLDPVLVLGDRRVRLAVHEWAEGAVDPDGYVHLAKFDLLDGVPRWRWAVGDVILEREVAMVQGSPAVAVVHRVVRAPGPVRLELSALCTWRDVHGERFADGDPFVERTADGFEFEGAYRVAGPGFEPGGQWYRGARYRVETERGLNDREDLWFAGAFAATLEPGEDASVTAWAGDLAEVPPPAPTVVASARERARGLVAGSAAVDEVDATLAMAADQFVVSGPTVVAGYPWFGDWSRDTMTSYEGLLLETRRFDEGRTLLLRAAASLSAGMLANTADVGGAPEYNTADATLWFLHAVGRHVDATGDDDLAATLAPALEEVVERHVAGTRYGIGVDRSDGLLTQGAPGVGLTWMDARVEGRPVTQRQGKAVEINALWINGLAMLATLQERVGRDSSGTRSLEETARASFARRFVRRGQVLDVVDGPAGDSAEVRPNQLLAVSLPHGPLRDPMVVRACAPLLTSVGLRSLAPFEPGYTGRHRGGPAERDAAYHQGTVWAWLIGPYVEAALRTGVDVAGVLDGLEAHLSEWGLGSVGETADGDPPHAATGCPFQAWSVAELLRARRLLARRTG